MVLEEKALPYTVVEESLREPSSALLRLHPEGKVPLLLHGDTVIHESAVITEYLDETFPERPLMPSDPKARAVVRLWTFWCNCLFKPDLDAYKYQWEKLGEEEQAALTARLRAHLAKLEEALAHQAFLLGPELTLADIHVFPFLRQFRKARPEVLSHFPPGKIDAWLERIFTRPSFERVMAKNPK